MIETFDLIGTQMIFAFKMRLQSTHTEVHAYWKAMFFISLECIFQPFTRLYKLNAFSRPSGIYRWHFHTAIALRKSFDTH